MTIENHTARRLAAAGLIAAMYAALSLLPAPLAFGPVQCRPAEALTVLAVYTPAAVPGLGVGCALTNLIGLGIGADVAGAADVIVGPLATLAAAWLSRRWRGRTVRGLPLLSTLPPVVINAVAVGAELWLVSPARTAKLLAVQIALVAAGEIVACVGGGLLLAAALRRGGIADKIDY